MVVILSGHKQDTDLAQEQDCGQAHAPGAVKATAASTHRLTSLPAAKRLVTVAALTNKHTNT
jgi:hypothetical protein